MDNTIVVARSSNDIPEFSTITGVTRSDGMAHLHTSGISESTLKIMRMAKKPRTEQTYGTYMKEFQD
jgi:hypothetical protein